MTEPTPINARGTLIREEEQELRNRIPLHLIEGLDRYVKYGTPTGHFLTAVLSNNLMDTFSRADETSMRHLEDLIRYIYNYVPYGCHGSIEAVNSWRGLDAMQNEEVK